MVGVILKCRFCKSENLIKAGQQSGHQRVKCKDCGKKYQLDYTYEATKPGVKEKIEKMAHNGSGIRDTARVLKINKNTVINHLKKKLAKVSYVNTNLISQLPDIEEKEALCKLEIDICISAECDEQWSYVEHKGNKRWLWYILMKGSKKVLGFAFGDRSQKTFEKLVDLLPEKLLDRLDTDGYICYKNIRFTPIHNVGKHLTTSIERKNLDLRNRIKRLGRKTSCFSKSEILHDAVIGRFINLYMF